MPAAPCSAARLRAWSKSSAAKSNAVYTAFGAARAFVKQDGSRPVPPHIRNAPTKLMKELGFGKEYRYAHDYPEGWVDQQYLPDRFVDTTFYDPSTYGKEASLVAQWRARTNRSHQDRPDTPVE